MAKGEVCKTFMQRFKSARRLQSFFTLRSLTTAELKIYIELERITHKSTKISVDAKKGAIVKDRATATEIIEQTERILEGRK